MDGSQLLINDNINIIIECNDISRSNPSFISKINLLTLSENTINNDIIIDIFTNQSLHWYEKSIIPPESE